MKDEGRRKKESGKHEENEKIVTLSLSKCLGE
jgi:hypothetical protein